MFCNCISLSCLTCDCACVIDVLGLLLTPLPIFSGVDASEDFDVLAIDELALIAHYDALAYDVSFRSWE